MRPAARHAPVCKAPSSYLRSPSHNIRHNAAGATRKPVSTENDVALSKIVLNPATVFIYFILNVR